MTNDFNEDTTNRDGKGKFAPGSTKSTDPAVLGEQPPSPDPNDPEVIAPGHAHMVSKVVRDLSDQETKLSTELEALRDKQSDYDAYEIAATCRQDFPGATTVELSNVGYPNVHPTTVMDADGKELGSPGFPYYNVGFEDSDHETRWDWAQDSEGNLDLAAIETRARQNLYGEKP